MNVKDAGETNNEKASARTAEKRLNADSLSGGRGETGSQGQGAWHQQERISGAASQRTNFFSSGTSSNGGMLDHLINEYTDQVDAKKQEKDKICNEIRHLESKIQGLKELKQELKNESNRLQSVGGVE